MVVKLLHICVKCCQEEPSFSISVEYHTTNLNLLLSFLASLESERSSTEIKWKSFLFRRLKKSTLLQLVVRIVHKLEYILFQNDGFFVVIMINWIVLVKLYLKRKGLTHPGVVITMSDTIIVMWRYFSCHGLAYDLNLECETIM